MFFTFCVVSRLFVYITYFVYIHSAFCLHIQVASTRVPRAHTLPNSNRSLTLSQIDLNNAINNNQLLRTRSPGGGHSVSIMSLPQSDDNEAFSFDNSALQLEDDNDDIHLSLSPSNSPIPDEVRLRV